MVETRVAYESLPRDLSAKFEVRVCHEDTERHELYRQESCPVCTDVRVTPGPKFKKKTVQTVNQ